MRAKMALYSFFDKNLAFCIVLWYNILKGYF